jgi:hypothetical protein
MIENEVERKMRGLSKFSQLKLPRTNQTRSSEGRLAAIQSPFTSYSTVVQVNGVCSRWNWHEWMIVPRSKGHDATEATITV